MSTNTDFEHLVKMHGSVAGVAKDLGIDRTPLYGIIRGKSKPSIDLYWKLADYLELSTDELRVYLDQG